MSLALRLASSSQTSTYCIMCMCTLSSWIQHSILFSQIWELQNFIFLGSRSWQKCKCNIPDAENLHADSMYPWRAFTARLSSVPQPQLSALTRHSGTRSWRHGSGCSILADLHYRAPTRQRAYVREHSDVEHRTQWRCPVPSKSHRYDVPEVEFKKMTPILRDFACPAWNDYLSCSENSKSSSTLAQASLWSVNRDWQGHDAGRQTV